MTPTLGANLTTPPPVLAMIFFSRSAGGPYETPMGLPYETPMKPLFLDFWILDFWCAFWGRDPSGKLRLEKSCWMAGSASESVGSSSENLNPGLELTFHTPICFGRLS